MQTISFEYVMENISVNCSILHRSTTCKWKHFRRSFWIFKVKMENDHGNHLHKSVAVSEAVWQFVELVVPTVMIHLTNLIQFLSTNFILNSYHDFNDHLRTHYQRVFFFFLFVYDEKKYKLFSFNPPPFFFIYLKQSTLFLMFTCTCIWILVTFNWPLYVRFRDIIHWYKKHLFLLDSYKYNITGCGSENYVMIRKWFLYVPMNPIFPKKALILSFQCAYFFFFNHSLVLT